MTRPRAPVWTDAHSRILLLGLTLLVGAGTGFTEGGTASGLVAIACGLTLVGGLMGDGWFGLLVGLTAAAGLTFTRQLTGTWSAAQFLPAAIETAALLALGTAAGRVGTFMRRNVRVNATYGDDARGVFGSLGMLSADLASDRLEEEVARATQYGRPLSLIVSEVQVDPVLGPAARDDVCRTVARLAESLLRETDVPFAIAQERIGAILPETDQVSALIALGRILEAIVDATYTDRDQEQRARVAEVAQVRMGAVSLGETFRTASEMLDGAIGSLLHRIPAA